MALWIGTSWKMNKTLADAVAYVDGLRGSDVPRGIRRFVVPPVTVLRDVAARLAGTDVTIGAQNMHWDDAGAWTGEVSAPMIVEAGAALVELGHSERRAHFGETDETVGRKVAAALRHDLIPLICIGETAEEKARGGADTVLATQTRAALAAARGSDATILLAYEPVWAIGDGGTPASPDYAAERHERIKAVAADVVGRSVPCLYGGSVDAGNCADLIARPGIDGLFIGRAAWDVRGYLDILDRCASAVAPFAHQGEAP